MTHTPTPPVKANGADSRRPGPFGVRLRPEELKAYAAACQAAGMGLSAQARRLVLAWIGMTVPK